MSGVRLVVGLVVMGLALPLVLFYLLDLSRLSQFFTLSAAMFLSWGVADLLANILGRPRLQNRSPGHAIGEEWERRAKD